MLGIKAKNGVVIATEKKTSTILADETSFEKIHSISSHVGVAYAGIGPDISSVVKYMRKKCIKYDQVYRDRMNLFLLSKDTAGLMQEYT